MSDILLNQLENRLREVRETRESLQAQEREHSQRASEIRREIIKTDGAEEQLQQLYDSVKSAMEEGL